MSQQHFASLYDVLMEDAPYKDWLDFTRKFVDKPSTVLDLACGTGTLTLLLDIDGYQTTGVDISGEMLAAAEQKARISGQNTPFIKQDMRKLTGFNSLDCVTLYCDGLNYLVSEQEVKNTFVHVAESLRSGGTFLFDVHSPFKMEHVFNHQLYGENAEEISYMWFCEPGGKPLSVHHFLTFFVEQEDGSYYRQDEELFQRTFPPSKYEKWLEEAGFTNIQVTGEFGNAQLKEEDPRVFFKAVKK